MPVIAILIGIYAIPLYFLRKSGSLAILVAVAVTASPTLYNTADTIDDSSVAKITFLSIDDLSAALSQSWSPL